MFDIRSLHQQQTQIAQGVQQFQLNEDFMPSWIAGADVGFEQQGAITRAAVVILSYPELTLVEYQIARIKTVMPYIPGLLSFREYPALLCAWEKLQRKPELLFVDGHGIAHPRRLGIASHFGLLVDIPTIGVAKNKLCGSFLADKLKKSVVTPLMEKEQQLGWVLQSKKKCNPLFISVGHRIDLNSVLVWTKKCLRGYKLPEPTRWADAVASQRSCFKTWIKEYAK